MAESSGKIVSNNVNLQLENKSVERSESVEENKTETAMEPILLEDYTQDNVPRSLQNLLDCFKREGIGLDKTDITVIFVYILMLETGFVTSDYTSLEGETDCNFHYKRLLSLTNIVPKNWKNSDTTYTLSFILAPYPVYICTITFICVSDDLVINCSIKCSHNINRNISMLLDSSMYVVNTTKLLFQNLRDLSNKIKNTISNPCKMFILEEFSGRPAGLKYLPPEIYSYLRKYCDKKSVDNLDKSCYRYLK